MSETFDAVILGGGIVGCACAYYLSQDFPRVALVEPGPIGGGATAAGMGHLVVMDDSEAQTALTKLSCQLWRDLRTELPPSVEYVNTGTLWVAADEEEMSHVSAKVDFYRRRGLAAEVIEAKALAAVEPNLREGLAGGLRVAGDSVIFPMPAAAWLLGQAARRGTMRVRAEAVSIGREVVLSDGSRLRAPIIINAAGDQAHVLTPGLPIQPRKGHLVITDRYPGFVNHQLIELGYLKSAHSMDTESVAFNVQPRATGQLLIGSSRQFVGWEPSVEARMIAKMLDRALSYIPGLASLKTVRTWTGFRAATPDKLPLIGPWPESPGLWIAAGHEGLGITTSLATGKLIADLVSGGPPCLDPAPFDPARKAHAASH